jgi:DNA end-binding protein Ku
LHQEEENERTTPRAFWSGTLSFGLVSIPVDLYAAIKPSRVSMRMLGPEGHFLLRRYVCSLDGHALENDEIVRGYPNEGEGRFVVISDEELAELEPRKSRDIDLRMFVPLSEIDRMLLVRPYVLAPAGHSTKAYHLLAATMEASKQAGIASFVMRGIEYLVAIFAKKGLLHAEILRFHNELRRPEDIGLPQPVKVPAARRKEMEEAVATLETDVFDRNFLHDETADDLLALAKRKQEESRDLVEVEKPPTDDEERDNVIDMMSLLKERIGIA